ncbi:MAG: MotA/TolQ/ExbB proton channel family protein [Kiritimatiellae bacterium]|nr:MotA/TolQ/ExbB proton channel family protein [Kiritimatiellia bacterium]
MKRLILSAVVFTGLMLGSAPVMAQDVDAPAAAAAEGVLVAEGGAAGARQAPKSAGFWAVIVGSGWLGMVLWAALFGCGGAAVYFIVDCSVLIRPQKVMPETLINRVKEGMSEGDVMKALQACESEPGPLANILTAGFSHVEEGFDIIQESIIAAADLETERLMQRLTWISVCSNLSPMLGLLGTVQGMIMSFSTLATGAPDVGALAMNISQALWTTAAGLAIAIPSITFYYAIRNNANRLVLRMQAMTMELIKDLRNVEIVSD